MPAAAVIPASVAYIKVAAVKRLVVGCQCRASVRWTLEREDKSCARDERRALAQCFRAFFELRAWLSQAPVRNKPPRLSTWRNLSGDASLLWF